MNHQFRELKQKYPHIGDVILFTRMISGKGYPKVVISRWFTRLVDPVDYTKNERKALLKFIFENGLK